MWLQRIKITFVLLSVALSAAVVLSLPPRGAGQEKTKVDYNHFTHKTHTGKVKVSAGGQTRELKCDSCHERQPTRDFLPMAAATTKPIVATTERNKNLQLKFPGHQACVDCHVIQFTSRPLQTCTICHNQDQGLSANPPQRDFPARKDYNAYFDRKQHADHVNKYALADGQKLDCGYCHKATAKQVAFTIPSHPTCYVCHAPESSDSKASLKSDCGVCHKVVASAEPPFSDKYQSRAYGAAFSHQTHVKYAGESCNYCHTIDGDYNQPAPSKLQVKEHLTLAQRSGRGCFSCHDGGTHFGRQAFSGEDTNTCAKCHKTKDKNGRFVVFKTEG